MEVEQLSRFRKDCAENPARVVQAMDVACEIADLAVPIKLPVEVDGLAFRLVSKEP